MRFTEKFLILFTLGGILLRVADTAGGAQLYLIGSLALALFYLLFSVFLVNRVDFRQIFSPALRSISSRMLLTGILCAFCWSLSVITLFLVLSGLEGSQLFFYLSVAALGILLATARRKEGEPSIYPIRLRTSVFLGMLLFVKVFELVVLSRF